MLVCVVTLLLAPILPTALAQESTPTPESTAFVEYTVVQGDTLGLISARFRTTTRAIMLANNITDPNLIFTGMVLQIPVATPTPTATEEATAEPTAEPTTELTEAPDATATATATQSAPVEVTPTDTISAPISTLPFDVGAEVFSFDHLDAMRSGGMTWAKVSIRWTPGTPVNNARRAVEMLQQNGFKVLLQVTGGAPPADYNVADYFPAYVSYLGEVAAFAPDAIEVWSGMNVEADWAHGLTDPNAYADLLEGAFRAIKTAHSETLVVSGALAETDEAGAPCVDTSCDTASYLSVMASNGVGQSADCIGMPYTLGAVSPDSTSGDPRGDQSLFYYSTVVTTYASLFPDKPLCFTRIGYLIPEAVSEADDESTAWAAGTTVENRAQWLAQAALFARQTGRIRLFVVYDLDATLSAAADYAIIGADGRCMPCLTLAAALGAG